MLKVLNMLKVSKMLNGFRPSKTKVLKVLNMLKVSKMLNVLTHPVSTSGRCSRIMPSLYSAKS